MIREIWNSVWEGFRSAMNYTNEIQDRDTSGRFCCVMEDDVSM